MFKNKTLLITGGTGSFGKSFLKFILKSPLQFGKIIIFSRDQFKQYSLLEELKKKKFKKLNKIRFILGDIRDKDRVKIAFNDVDFVVHAAALKQVPVAEYNPIEFVNTNIMGAQNIIEACYNSKVKKVVALSTDKAVAPKNFYGATKLCSDKLFISANNIIGKSKTVFSVVRYGNVDGSRGSVIPLFLSLIKEGKPLPVTSLSMTRFSISLEKAIILVLTAFEKSIGGEIYIPKLPSYSLKDLVKAINPPKGFRIIGKRQGEKLHEELITIEESEEIYDFKNYYVLFNNNLLTGRAKTFIKKMKKRKILKNFSYNSNASKKLSVSEIKKIINKH